MSHFCSRENIESTRARLDSRVCQTFSKHGTLHWCFVRNERSLLLLLSLSSWSFRLVALRYKKKWSVIKGSLKAYVPLYETISTRHFEKTTKRFDVSWQFGVNNCRQHRHYRVSRFSTRRKRKEIRECSFFLLARTCHPDVCISSLARRENREPKRTLNMERSFRIRQCNVPMSILLSTRNSELCITSYNEIPTIRSLSITPFYSPLSSFSLFHSLTLSLFLSLSFSFSLSLVLYQSFALRLFIQISPIDHLSNENRDKGTHTRTTL